MATFVEKTLAEQGFGTSWTRYVAPALASNAKQVRRRLVFAIAASSLALLLAVVAIAMRARVHDDMILAQPFDTALVVALAALAIIGSWVVVLRFETPLAAPVRAAVEAHFAALFTQDENIGFGQVVLQDLVADGILDEAPHAVSAHYAGTYGDCRIRLIEASASLPRRAVADLIVLRVSLPFFSHGEIRGDSDIGRIKALIDEKAGFAGFHVDHDQFDRIFTAACTDLGEGVRIVTRGFAETLLQIQHRLASPLDEGNRSDPRVAFQVADGSLTVIVESKLHHDRSARLGRGGAERLARELVMRFAAVPALVDELHGEAEMPPAFRPLPPAEAASPHISF